MAIDTEGTPQHAAAFFELGPVCRRHHSWCHLAPGQVVVEAVETQHLDKPYCPGRTHSGTSKEHGSRFVRGHQGPRLCVGNRQEVFSLALASNNSSQREASGGPGLKRHKTYPHLLSFEILPTALVEDLVVHMVLGVSVGSQGPDNVLETHRWSQVRSRVVGIEVAARVDNGDEVLLLLEEHIVSAAVRATL